jgi:transposase-like protein
LPAAPGGVQPAMEVPNMPVLIQPEHHDAITRLAQDGPNAPVRRRAQLLLLYDAGHPTEEVVQQVGLSASSVLRWRRLYREQGMNIFPDVEEQGAPESEPASPADATKGAKKATGKTGKAKKGKKKKTGKAKKKKGDKAKKGKKKKTGKAKKDKEKKRGKGKKGNKKAKPKK